MTLTEYKKYKPAGYLWLGNVPSHWDVVRLKFSANARPSNVDKHVKDDEVKVKLCNYVDVYNNEFITGGIEFMSGSATKEEIEKFSLKNGDVVITKDSESWSDIAVPALVRDDLADVVCGYHLAQIRAHPGAFHSGYLFRLFCSEMLNYQFKVSAKGVTRYGLPLAAIENAILLRPPVEEQREIAEFLDCETIRIDALVAKNQSLLQLLDERKLSVVTKAVTRGLNLAVQMKESDLPWLPLIPKHWELIQAKFVLGLGDYGISASMKQEGEFGVLRMGDIGYGTVSTSDLARIDGVDGRLLLRPGDLLFNRTNSYEQVAKVGLFLDDSEAKVTFASYLVRFRPSINVRYLTYLLNIPAFLGFARSHSLKAIGQVNLNPTRYAQLKICVPPSDEQSEIVTFLDSEIGKIDALKSKVNSAVGLLREYRSSLITNAVTGKIDVRAQQQREAAE